MLFLFFAIIIAISIWQGNRLINEKKYQELKVFIFLQVIALVYGIIVILDLWDFSPFRLIIDIMEMDLFMVKKFCSF
ncbi:MAG: hypothetical protein ACOCV3_03235 [Halanaerobiales bacterium]